MDKVGLAQIIRNYVLEIGQTTIAIRDLRRYIRANGAPQFTENYFYDIFKEMTDAGWIKEVDYLRFVIYFDKEQI